jgi:hypothetical protein
MTPGAVSALFSQGCLSLLRIFPGQSLLGPGSARSRVCTEQALNVPDYDRHRHRPAQALADRGTARTWHYTAQALPGSDSVDPRSSRPRPGQGSSQAQPTTGSARSMLSPFPASARTRILLAQAWPRPGSSRTGSGSAWAQDLSGAAFVDTRLCPA